MPSSPFTVALARHSKGLEFGSLLAHANTLLRLLRSAVHTYPRMAVYTDTSTQTLYTHPLYRPGGSRRLRPLPSPACKRVSASRWNDMLFDGPARPSDAKRLRLASALRALRTLALLTASKQFSKGGPAGAGPLSDRKTSNRLTHTQASPLHPASKCEQSRSQRV